MSFVGGKLKLKGGDGLSAKGGAKKKKSKKHGSGDIVLSNGDDSSKAKTEGFAIEEQPEDALLDRRTPAERRHDELLSAREKERIAKMAGKSHRQKVAEFNEYLSNLTEHHDIPKVGPG